MDEMVEYQNNSAYAALMNEYMKLQKELAGLRKLAKELCSVTSDIIFAIQHCEQDPFANGVTYMGQDEGSIRGWEYLREREERFTKLAQAIKEE